MANFAQSNLVNRFQVKNNQGHPAILLVCIAVAIVFLIALILASASHDTALSELTSIAVPP
jgi:hypothetical protein